MGLNDLFRGTETDYTKDSRFVRFDEDTCYLKCSSGKEIAFTIDVRLTLEQTDKLRRDIQSGENPKIPFVVHTTKEKALKTNKGQGQKEVKKPIDLRQYGISRFEYLRLKRLANRVFLQKIRKK